MPRRSRRARRQGHRRPRDRPLLGQAGRRRRASSPPPRRPKALITVEDHWAEGGIGETVAGVLAEAAAGTPLVRLAVSERPGQRPAGGAPCRRRHRRRPASSPRSSAYWAPNRSGARGRRPGCAHFFLRVSIRLTHHLAQVAGSGDSLCRSSRCEVSASHSARTVSNPSAWAAIPPKSSNRLTSFANPSRAFFVSSGLGGNPGVQRGGNGGEGAQPSAKRCQLASLRRRRKEAGRGEGGAGCPEDGQQRCEARPASPHDAMLTRAAAAADRVIVGLSSPAIPKSRLVLPVRHALTIASGFIGVNERSLTSR